MATLVLMVVALPGTDANVSDMATLAHTKELANLWPAPRSRQGRVLNSYTPLTDDTIRTAASLWISNPESAASTYGDISMWDTSNVTSMNNRKSIVRFHAYGHTT
jgi:hypothetical protein